MQLTWEKGYADYTDTANWQPRYDQLCRFAQSVDPQAVTQLSDSQLLDALELLEELMRFYCVESDMQKLETVMRKFNALMNLCRQRQMTGVEVQYLEMLFLRVNAMLYRMHGQHRQGADCYDKCVEAAKACFGTLKGANHLTGDQQLYVGWSCIECWKEAAEAHDAVMDAPGTLRLMHEVVPMLEWVDKWLVAHPGICDQASELHVAAAGMFYQYGDAPAGNNCYRHAVRLLNALDDALGSDFYRARAIWIMSIHGTMALLGVGDASVMLQCEKEAGEYLALRRRADIRDRSIVAAAQAAVSLQRSTVLQQNGKLDAAIGLARDGVAQLENSLRIIQKDYQNRQGYYRSVMSGIASRIYNVGLGSKESLGVMYYQSGDLAACETTMKEVLEELTKTTGLRMSGSGSVLIQAEVLQYLGLIASDNGDSYQADFYGTQSADMAITMARESNNVNAWSLAVGSCSLVAEIALQTKNKPKAAKYAEMGLTACEMLAQGKPDHPYLALRSDLEKYRKKALRRFF